MKSARVRLTEIQSKLDALDILLTTKLNGTITLESKVLIDEAIKAMDGLAAADIATLTSYEQYFVPAVVDYVNLLIDTLYTDGELTAVSQDNVAALKDTLAQIDISFCPYS